MRPDARRATTLPTAHEAAAADDEHQAEGGRRDRAADRHDAEAHGSHEHARDLRALGRSRRARAAITTVSPTWACSTSEARPAGIPTARAV